VIDLATIRGAWQLRCGSEVVAEGAGGFADEEAGRPCTIGTRFPGLGFHNFEILEVEPLCVIAEDQLRREELHTPFDSKSSEDLAVVQVRITARPTSGGSPSSAENGV